MQDDGNLNGSPSPVTYRFASFSVNERNRQLFSGEKEVQLTPKVLDVLLVFLSNPERVLDKDELIEKIWDSKFVEEGNLARNVSTLRKALGGDAHDRRYIVTVPGRGYRFVAEVSTTDRNGLLPKKTGRILAQKKTYLNGVNRYLLILSLPIVILLAGSIWFANSYLHKGIAAAPQEAKPLNPEAQQAYSTGRYLFRQSFDKVATVESRPLLLKSIENYQQAISLEPDFAPAYSGYARACQWLAGSGYEREYNFSRARVAAKKAIELDETLSEAHGALAFNTYDYMHDLKGAEGEFTRALDLDPNSEFRRSHAMNLAMLGRIDEAVSEIETAMRNDPSQVVVRQNAGRIYLEAGNIDKALEEFRGVVELAPQNPIGFAHLGIANVLAGNYDDGLSEIQKYLRKEGGSEDRAILAWAYALSGQRDKALKIAAEFSQKSKGRVPAMIYSGLGENEKALTELERECAESKRTLTELRLTPFYFNLRNEVRYQELLRKLDNQSGS
jgi:DNA-binding winged helix-turn-helix (wHTH) protein/Tfp pilus assembly protein PilF